jgi:hypothetical protein
MSSAPGPVDFCWGADNTDVVLRAYGSVAVHENPYGDVVIRQERSELEDEDHFVVLPVHDAEFVAHAIIRKAAEIKAATPPTRPPKEEREPRLALPAPAHLTARPTIVKRGVG